MFNIMNHTPNNFGIAEVVEQRIGASVMVITFVRSMKRFINQKDFNCSKKIKT